VMILQKREAPQYIPKIFLQGIQELRNIVPPDDVIFASDFSGNFIAGYAIRPMVLGHIVMTTDIYRKRSMVETFFRKNAGDPTAKRILEASGAKWFFWGPPEIWLG